MKKSFKVFASTALVALGALALAACDNQQETTTRLEAEWAQMSNVENVSISMKGENNVPVSNNIYINPNGGFKFEVLNDLTVTFKFTSSHACDATIKIANMSANTFGNGFDLDDTAYEYYLNNAKLGTPASVVDYEGNPTTSCPKEDFIDFTGYIYMTYNVKLVKGDNTFEWRYKQGNQAFKFDYIDITGKTNIEWTPDKTLENSYDPEAFNF